LWDQNAYRIHYGGWKSRWDETLDADSNRFAKACSRSRCQQGPSDEHLIPKRFDGTCAGCRTSARAKYETSINT
jgi:hypothetical protein